MPDTGTTASWMARVANPLRPSGCSSGGMAPPLGLAVRELAPQRRQRQRPQGEDTVVEALDGEPGPLTPFGFTTPLGDLELPQLVRAGLARHRDVAVDLDLRVDARLARGPDLC